MRQIIRKSNKANVFLLFWVNDQEIIPESQITLDFNPILEHLGEKKGLCLVHYQAKPKNLRRFGVWCNGEYFATNDPISSAVPSMAICLKESELKFPPNAVIAYPGSYFEADKNLIRAIQSSI